MRISTIKLEDRHRKTLDIFSKHSFSNLLDVCCGDGEFSMLIKKECKAKEIYGIEVSEERVELAREHGVKTVQMDVDRNNFPFLNGFFDAVFAGEAIEHVFDTDHLLEEVYRVLKPHGLFVLSTPNLAAIHNRLALLFGFQPFPLSVSLRYNVGRAYEPRNTLFDESREHVRVFTLKSLKRLLKFHSFEIVEVKGSTAVMLDTMRWLKVFTTVDKVVSMFPSLSYRVIIECKKL